MLEGFQIQMFFIQTCYVRLKIPFVTLSHQNFIINKTFETIYFTCCFKIITLQILHILNLINYIYQMKQLLFKI